MKQARASRATFGQQLIESTEQAAAIANGTLTSGYRETTLLVPREVRQPVDVKAIRTRMNLSQREFAAQFGFALATVRNWEQGRREPERPAKILLAVLAAHPEIVDEVLA